MRLVARHMWQTIQIKWQPKHFAFVLGFLLNTAGLMGEKMRQNFNSILKVALKCQQLQNNNKTTTTQQQDNNGAHHN